MLNEPKCFVRNCKHFQGVQVRDPNTGDADSKYVCRAFPNGIPDEISVGDNLHLKPYPGDHGIQYEKRD